MTTRTSKILPDPQYVGKIFVRSNGSPHKNIENGVAFIVTRITKTKMVVRALEHKILKKPIGNGYFVEANLGSVPKNVNHILFWNSKIK